MLTGIHFLLTCKCIYECDHCFVYSSPRANGTFTLEQIDSVLDEAEKIGTIEWIYFEGGEPFLYYPLLLEGIKSAKQKGFKTGIVTNAYFATNLNDTNKWLLPLQQIGINDLSISNDLFHYDNKLRNHAITAFNAAKKMGMNVNTIEICEPDTKTEKTNRKKGEPIVGGDVVFRGRAADKLTEGLPRVKWDEFNECPHEELINPERVHVDAFGNVHICQGISIGNMWPTPLSELIKSYNVNNHPVCSLLANEGPAGLAKAYMAEHENSYVDACHLCYEVRKKLISKFPEYLAPRQIYGFAE